MRNRCGALAGTVAGALVLLVVAVPPATALLDATLVASPDRGIVPTTVTLSGTCDPTVKDGSAFYPEPLIGLTQNGDTLIAKGPFPVDANGRFAGVEFALPASIPPGDYLFVSSCDADTWFTVLAAPAPTLQIEPNPVAAGEQAIATGVCPPRLGGDADLFLDDQRVASLRIDPVTGEFPATPFSVPDDAAVGNHEVTTSCDGFAPLGVLPAIEPPTEPPPGPPTVGPTGLVTVPDLTGLSADDALTRLGSDLVLGAESGTGDQIVGQDPPPGTQVQPGTAVAVVLAASVGPAAAEESSASVPLFVVVLAIVLAVLAGTGLGLRRARLRRIRRERHWVQQQTDASAEVTGIEVSAPPAEPVVGVCVEIDVSREPATPHFRR